MKAKIINESLGSILKPKSKEDILKSLLEFNPKSYKLSSFFNLIDKKTRDALQQICDENNLNPQDMDVSMFSGGLFEIFMNIFNRKSYLNDVKQYRFSEIYTKQTIGFTEYFFTYDYSRKYKVIKFNSYFAYPKHELNNILMQNI